MKVNDEIKLDNDKTGRRYVYYAKHMNNDVNQYEIVMCIEDEQGFRPIDHPDFKHMEKKEAKAEAEALNKAMGMDDSKQNLFIVASTMRRRNRIC